MACVDAGPELYSGSWRANLAWRWARGVPYVPRLSSYPIFSWRITDKFLGYLIVRASETEVSPW